MGRRANGEPIVTEMTSAQRVLAVLSGQTPDRVPVMELFIDPKVIESIRPGMSTEDFADFADLDVVTCLTMAEDPASLRWVDEANRIWRDKWGALQRMTDEVISVVAPPARIEAEADLASYRPPEAGSASVIEQVRRLVERFKGRRAIAVVGEAVFAPAQYLRAGLEALCYDLFDRPELVHKLMGIGVDYHVELYRRLIAEGAEIVVLGDDYAYKSGPLISPAHFRQFILPGLRTVVREIKAAGGYVIKHTDGDIRKLLDMLFSTGIDMLGPLEPAYMDLEEVRRRSGGSVGVMGNVDVDLLSCGTAEQVRQATMELLRRVSPGGRHILSSGNSISSSVRGENLMTMLRTVQQFGRYPIDVPALS